MNDWKCRRCGLSGHKQYECTSASSEFDEDDEYMKSFKDTDFHKHDKGEKSDESGESDDDTKSQDDDQEHSQDATQPPVNTEVRETTDTYVEQSQSILGVQETVSSENVPSQTKTTKTRSKSENRKQENIKQFFNPKRSEKGSSQENIGTPKQPKSRQIEKSPVTPTETLHDATANGTAKKAKKRKIVNLMYLFI